MGSEARGGRGLGLFTKTLVPPGRPHAAHQSTAAFSHTVRLSRVSCEQLGLDQLFI